VTEEICVSGDVSQKSARRLAITPKAEQFDGSTVRQLLKQQHARKTKALLAEGLIEGPKCCLVRF
jgi:uncharacterized protein (UPF0218 family)